MNTYSRAQMSRLTSNSRPVHDLQLPKINKHPLQQSATFLERYEWLTKNAQYLLLSTPSIAQQQQYLTNQLMALDSEYSDLLQKVNSNNLIVKPLKKSRQMNANDRSSHLRDREIDNNNQIIYKLKNQCQMLLRRVSSVDGPAEFDMAIVELKEKIFKTKGKIKDLKMKSREIGDNIENGQDMYSEMKKFQNERDATEARRWKLEEKLTLSAANLKRLLESLEEINGQYVNAQSYLGQQSVFDKANAEQRTIEQLFRQRSYQLEITKKTIESIRNTRQQKCHQALKSLESMVEKLNLFDSKLNKLQIKNFQQKKQLMEMEEVLEQLQADKIRSKTSEQMQQEAELCTEVEIVRVLQRQNSSTDRNKFQIIKRPQAKLKRINGMIENIRQKGKSHNRMKSSETRAQIYNNRTTIERKEVFEKNRNNITDIQPVTIETKDVLEMTKMINQSLPNRNYFRTSRTKLKDSPLTIHTNDEITEKQQSHKGQIQKQDQIAEEMVQESPTKIPQTDAVAIDKELPLKQQIIEQTNNFEAQLTKQKEQNIVESIGNQQSAIQNQQQTVKAEHEHTDELKRKKQLISNYLDRLEESEDK